MSNLMKGGASLGRVDGNFAKPQMELRRRGMPLPEDVREQAEELFGQDFSDVRIIVSDAAPQMGAIAFTTGSEIHIAPGVYKPGTPETLALLGHELAHVVQQRQGRAVNPYGYGTAVVRDQGLEAEADRMGKALQMMQDPRHSRYKRSKESQSAYTSPMRMNSTNKLPPLSKFAVLNSLATLKPTSQELQLSAEMQYMNKRATDWLKLQEFRDKMVLLCGNGHELEKIINFQLLDPGNQSSSVQGGRHSKTLLGNQQIHLLDPGRFAKARQNVSKFVKDFMTRVSKQKWGQRMLGARLS